MDTQRFTVGDGEGGQRLDRLVVSWLAEAGHPTPRAEIQRWIEQGRVRRITRDGSTVPLDKKTKLPAGTVVEVEPGLAPLSAALPEPDIVLSVLFEDDHLLVIDKPAGLVVHPARGHRTGTLVNGLLAQGGFDAGNADPRDPDGHLRPGIVHRLDKDTSGLLVVAKDPRTREGLKALFAAHDIERSYLALVSGRARPARYDTPHGRHPRHRLRFTSQLPDEGGYKRACTEVAVVEVYGDVASLVRCTLQTGKTHQIRVHMAEQSRTPILGDPLYGPRGGREDLRTIGATLGRQALHAEVLGFVHPITGAALRWQSPLPQDMAMAEAALQQLTRPPT